MADTILIVGAGVAGLALAQGLKKNNIKFRIFERDTSHDHRKQGYRIRLHKEAIDALQYLLPDDLWNLFKLCAADMRLGPLLEIDAVTAAVADVKFGKGNAPPPVDAASKPYTVDRVILRNILLRGLEEHIVYGHAAMGYEIKTDHIVVSLNSSAGQSSVTGSLLVAADGSQSAIRRQLLPTATLLDTGAHCVYGRTLLTAELKQQIAPTALQRMSNIKDRSRSQMLSMVLEPITFPNREDMLRQGIEAPADYLYWVLAAHADALGLPSPKPSPTQCEDIARKIAQEWHPTLRVIIDQQMKDDTSVLPLYSFAPALPVWAPNERVTLIGDAIHLMSPAAGSGAVTAVRDAYHLCQALKDGGGKKEDAIGGYESSMREYAGTAISNSFMAGRKLFEQKAWEECRTVV